ncbi:MAG: nicotinate-nucleotide adenylyltransferase [Actinobacteria bacterium]|nr:nicotinate-nucleotide adenylyltransferase [Actinomycetota bacterium]
MPSTGHVAFKICEKFDRIGFDDVHKEHRLGIMGGTFDPIHFGHLVCAEQAREEFGLEAVIFMPAGSPTRKLKTYTASADHRFRMTQIAIESNPLFDVSRLEVDREGPIYTVDTMRVLRDHYPPNVKFYFITGADAIADVATWYGAEELARLTSFIAVTRPGYPFEAAQTAIQKALFDIRIEYLQIPELAISSTALRKRISEGHSIRYLTPDAICSYIEDNGLYYAEKSIER